MRATRILDPRTKGDRRILWEAWKWEKNLPPRLRVLVQPPPLKNFFRNAQRVEQVDVGFWMNFRLYAVITWADCDYGRYEVGLAAHRGCPTEELCKLFYQTGFNLFRGGARELFCYAHRKNIPARMMAKRCGFTEKAYGDRVKLFMNRGTYEDYHAHLGGDLNKYDSS